MTELERAIEFNQEIQAALLTVYNELNQGQQKKLLRNDTIKALFNRYGVIPNVSA